MLYSLSFIGLLAIILGGAYAVKKFLDNRQVKFALQSPVTIEASSKYVNIVESQ
jgi:flagellar biogenesis protein FliO